MTINRKIVVADLINTRALNVVATFDCSFTEPRHLDALERELAELRGWLDKIILAFETARLTSKQEEGPPIK